MTKQLPRAKAPEILAPLRGCPRDGWQRPGSPPPPPIVAFVLNPGGFAGLGGGKWLGGVSTREAMGQICRVWLIGVRRRDFLFACKVWKGVRQRRAALCFL